MTQKARQDVSPLLRTSSPVLVGRGHELESLVSAVPAQPAVIMVEGEAGVGKSRIVRELLGQAELARLQIMIGYCQPLREPFPYGAVLEALHTVHDRLAQRPALSAVAGVLRPLLPELADQLPEAPDPTGDPRTDRHRLFRAIRELLAVIGPGLLVIEDLHWADDGSRQLLRFLMADPPDTLSILVTYRREEVPGGMPLGTAYRPPAGITSALIQLHPLDVAEVRSLTQEILGEDVVSAEFASKLHERTAGIPFVVEETLRALRNPAGAVHADGATARRLLDAVEVPVLLRDAMSERLAGLPTTATRLVQAAAVLGVPASADLLGEVAGISEQRVRVALTHALDSHVLREVGNGRYDFRHALAQQAVYDTLGGPDRQQLHRRAIPALSKTDPKPLVQLAEHAERAGMLADWFRYGESAADRAAQVGDAATATRMFQRLLAEPTLPAGDVDRLAIKLGQIAHTGLDQRDPVMTLERLLNDPRLSTSARGEVRLFVGLLLIRQTGGLDTGRAQIELAIADLQERPDLAGKGTAVLAQPFFGNVPLQETQLWMRRVEKYRELTDSSEQRIALLANELSSKVHTGNPRALGEVHWLPDHVETLAEQRQLARARCNLADGCVAVGHFQLAESFLQSGMQLAADSGSAFVVSSARATKVRLDWFTGQWEGLVERALRLLEEYRDLMPVSSELCLVLGWLAVTRGEWGEAATYLTETGAYAPEEAISPVAIAGCAGLARLALSQDEVLRASADIDRGLTILRLKGVWAWVGEILPVAVEVFIAAGRGADAVELVRESEREIANLEVPLPRAALAYARGCVAEHENDHDGAIAQFTVAARQYSMLPAPYLTALATERAAMSALATDGADPVAAEQLSALVDTFDGLGATLDAARCRHQLRVVGGVKPSKRGRRGYGNELSPRELEVARLLAGGHTNREIADVLFLSPRTVEQHAARVLRKLGVTSRAELQAEDL